jgi:xanthine dehydrogenase accessory factor
MKKELLQLAASLTERGEPFVLAMVVRREAYSSAHQGDMAIITVDGRFHGWLGGSCTRPSVQREAARALADGKPRFISLSPAPDPHPRAGATQLPMTCHSGGTVDIYLEPILAASRLVVFGVSPIARTLLQLAKVMGYSVDVVDPDATAAELPSADRVFTDLAASELTASGAAPFVVVASMGEHDEDAVEAALRFRPAYLGVVASRKRFAILRDTLVGRGVAPESLDKIKNPAGLDLGGRTPQEVALSILAEIVQLRSSEQSKSEPAAKPAEEEATDPVCNMKVVVATARHKGEWNGRTWYFCNGRCKDRFLADPHRYLDAPPGVAR